MKIHRDTGRYIEIHEIHRGYIEKDRATWIYMKIHRDAWRIVEYLNH